MAQASNRCVLDAVIQNFVVDLVRKDDQAVFSRQVNDFLEQGIGIQHPSWVVRVDHHNTFGVGRYFFTNVVDVRHPAIGFVA